MVGRLAICFTCRVDAREVFGIFDGFEGRRNLTHSEIRDLIKRGLVVLDTNVLFDLYRHESSAREEALTLLRKSAANLWIPHQVIMEFWRTRITVLSSIKPTQTPKLDEARQEAYAILNRASPMGKSAAAGDIRARIDELFDALTDQLQSVIGQQLSVKPLLTSVREDPVVSALEEILANSVGRPFTAEELVEVTEVGRKRYENSVPPGFADAKNKDEEEALGDYFLWEQVLRHMMEEGQDAPGFVLVTGDSKKDWRERISGERNVSLGARPELLQEAHDRTSRPFALLLPQEFYSHLSEIHSFNADAIISGSQRLQEETDAEGEMRPWLPSEYAALIGELRSRDATNQLKVIEAAARSDGFVTRQSVYELCNFKRNRSLVRFVLPALGAARAIVPSNEVGPPLWATYDGPGKAIGYRVPAEFVEFEAELEDQRFIDEFLSDPVTDPEA